METASSIIDFWFGSSEDDLEAIRTKSKSWWSQDKGVDGEIRERFGPIVLSVERGELDAWASSPEGLLALVLTTDQFPRNIYRGGADSFGFDPLARRFCSLGLAQGVPNRLRFVERVFFYLPLEHSESMEDQEKSVGLFRALASEVPASLQSQFEGYMDFAIRHRDIIARFGRFPHRNAILNRESTPEELEFLKEPDSSF